MARFVISYLNTATVPDPLDVDATALPADVHDEISDHISGTGGVAGLSEAFAWEDLSDPPAGDDGTRERIRLRIGLLVEAEDEAAAEAMPVPVHVLAEVADAMSLDLRPTGAWSVGEVAAQDLVPTP